jgi:hypothetical protein
MPELHLTKSRVSLLTWVTRPALHLDFSLHNSLRRARTRSRIKVYQTAKMPGVHDPKNHVTVTATLKVLDLLRVAIDAVLVLRLLHVGGMLMTRLLLAVVMIKITIMVETLLVATVAEEVGVPTTIANVALLRVVRAAQRPPKLMAAEKNGLAVMLQLPRATSKVTEDGRSA